VATAAAPHDDDLTDVEWARAMLDVGVLPSMQTVFSLAFLSGPSSRSYTLAGAFITWLADTRGMAVVRAWYHGESVVTLTGASWAELDRDFRAYLRSVPIAPEAQSFAIAKFARPGIFARTCPHVVDALREQADVCRDTQRYDDAIRLYSALLAKDPHDFRAQHDRAALERRHGDKLRGAEALAAMANASDDRVPRPFRDRAQEVLADAAYIDGDFDQARRLYASVAARSLDEDFARMLEIKAFAAQESGASSALRRAVQALLIGDGSHGTDMFVAGLELGAARTAAFAPALTHYLVGRTLLKRGWDSEAAQELDVAIRSDLPSERIAREALRLRAVLACAHGESATVDALKARLNDPQGPFSTALGGRRRGLEMFLNRCSVQQ